MPPESSHDQSRMESIVKEEDETTVGGWGPGELRAKKHLEPVRRSMEEMRRRDTARVLGRIRISGLYWRANALNVGMKVLVYTFVSARSAIVK